MTRHLLRLGSVAAIVMIWTWLTATGSDAWAVFVYAIVTATAVAIWRVGSRGRGRVRTIAARVCVGIGLWAMLSLAVTWRTPRLESDASRFARINASPALEPLTSRWKGLRIGLALSGGGYRAAVFHAGVLQALEHMGIRASNLSTVSGGSIIGAYYAVGGAPQRFSRSVANGDFNLRRQLLLFHNAIRLPFAGLDRLDVQAALLDRILFSRAALSGGLEPDEPAVGQPRLMISATDLAYGFQVGMLPNGFLVRGVLHGYPTLGPEVRPVSPFRLAERVAVSGAFPIAFPPRRVTWRINEKSKSGITFALIDGGIRDNTGALMARLADARSGREFEGIGLPPLSSIFLTGWTLDALLVSDASAPVGVAKDITRPIELLSRTFDLATIGRNFSDVGTFRTCAEPVAAPIVFSAPAVRPEEGLFDTDFEWDLRVNLVGYPTVVVRAMIEALPPVVAREALELFERYLEARSSEVVDDDSLRTEVHRALTDRTPQVPSKSATSALALARALQSQLLSDLDTFRFTATLDDTLEANTVAALERLGKLTVLNDWPRMNRLLNKAAECRAQSATAGSDKPETTGARLPE